MKAAFVTLVSSLFTAGTAFAEPVMPADEPLFKRHSELRKRAECGPGIGSCNNGSCCSESGFCGTTKFFCGGSSCQLEYSDSCDTFFGPSGANTENIPRPKLGDVPYGSVITTCTTPGVIALTFDDGPFNYTNEILDLLDEKQVTATFFIAGNNRGKGHIDDSANPWPAMLRRMYSAGHHIASHTWTHRNLNQINSTIQRTEMIYNEMAFRNLFGWIPTYMRPPYLECNAGSGCLDLMEELGYHVITSNIDTKDYQYDNPELIQIAKDRYCDGVSADPENNEYIVLAHDVHEQTVAELAAYMIDTARERGYRLVTVGECLGDPRENWYRRMPRERSHTPIRGPTSINATASTNVSEPSGTVEPTGGLKISSNQRCAGNTDSTCEGSRFGNCCSWYGYCGSSDEYCGTGCDADFGSCKPPEGEVHDTTNGLCGSALKATCSNYGKKKCCSAYGYCGNTSDHCGSGCQEGFGECE
ncbi:chitin binding [Fusarium albosuccineum]|uniref:Chitin binding n=1 Tax=Fusarium albosuccineum TaxID=1237068 RepID=A0A8H4LEX9_9HYPO|nr:chitin binding [Fusarium albosuccineum]